MPYGAKKQGEKICVYKFGEDGEISGDTLGCHDSKADADKQVAALYAADKKAVAPTTTAPVVKQLALATIAEVGEKCGDYAVAAPYVPLGGATSFEQADAVLAAEQQAAAINDLTWKFQALTQNALASPDAADKGFAIVRLATEFRRRLDQALVDVGKALGMSDDKAGARHSKTDQDMLQQVHDNAIALGAMCEKAKAAGSAFLAFKDHAGDYRWLGMFSNRFKDLDGEIIPEAAHREFLAYLDLNPAAAPEWWTWHEDMGRKSRADAWDYLDGFMLISGKCTKEQAQPYIDNPAPRAMSHGFRAVKRNKVFDLYRTFEVSDLDPSQAANPWTPFGVLQQDQQKEATMGFTPEKRAYFVKLFGEVRATELEGQAAAQSKALQEAGVEFKETATPPVAPAARVAPATTVVNVTPVTPVATDAPVVVNVDNAPPAAELSPATLAAVVEAVNKALNPDGLNEALVQVASKVDALQGHVLRQDAAIEALQVSAQKSRDDVVADALAPRITPRTWGVRPTAAQETMVKEGAGAGSGTALPAAVEKALAESGLDWVGAIGPLA